MFGFLARLFGGGSRRGIGPEWVAPTKAQLNYARKLRISVAPDMDRDDVSALIGDAERSNPSLKQGREQAKERRRAKGFGPELIAQEQQWSQLADQNKWAIVVYKKGKSIKSAVLQICGASISDKGKLKIEAEVGKIVREKHIGETVDTEQFVEIDAASLLWSQIVDDIDCIQGVETFRRHLELAEKMASKHA